MYADMNGVGLDTALKAVGKGWHPLVREVYKTLPEHIKVVQVKEKFGGLRIYTDVYTEYLLDVLEQAQRQSFTVCEFCGEEGEKVQTSRGWIKTLCSKCKENK